MADLPTPVEVLARSLCASHGDVWVRVDEVLKTAWRRDAQEAIAALEAASFVIMPGRPTEKILRVFYGQGYIGITPSRFYAKLIKAR